MLVERWLSGSGLAQDTTVGRVGFRVVRIVRASKSKTNQNANALHLNFHRREIRFGWSQQSPFAIRLLNQAFSDLQEDVFEALAVGGDFGDRVTLTDQPRNQFGLVSQFALESKSQ